MGPFFEVREVVAGATGPTSLIPPATTIYNKLLAYNACRLGV